MVRGNRVVVAFSVLLVLLATSSAALNAKPDVILFDSNRGGNYELYTMALDGTGPVTQLTDDPLYDSWWGRPSPDGARILFYRTPNGTHDQDYGQASLWRINSDGTGLVQLRARGEDGWTIQGHGEWSPDGQSITTLGTVAGNIQVFVVDADGKNPRQVTTGPTLKLDSSWSPDGLSLLFITMPVVSADRRLQEVYRIPAAGGTAERLTYDMLEDYDPYYNPQGTRIAWLTQTVPNLFGPGLGAWNIRVMDADGTNVANITNDVHINSKPAWSPDGSTIIFHRFVYGGSGWRIYRTPASGGGPITLVGASQVGHNSFPCYIHYAPLVVLTSPAAGAVVSGVVTLAAEAVSAANISQVRFQVDGVDVGTDTTAPYSVSWDASAASAGAHTMRAIATDAVGSAGTAVTVTVSVVSGGTTSTSNSAASTGLVATASSSIGTSSTDASPAISAAVSTVGVSSITALAVYSLSAALLVVCPPLGL